MMHTFLATAMDYIIYTDGCSLGNPGRAGAGIAIYQAKLDGGLIPFKEYAIPLGTMTNNQAEYSALVHALKKLKQVLGKDKVKNVRLEVRADSELLVRQLNHQYKILDAKVQALFFEAWNLLIDFGGAVFVHVPREKNTVADRLSKEAASSQATDSSLFA